MKFNPVLKKKYRSFSELESAIENVQSTKEMGDVFEEFIFAYLKLKSNLYQINKVYTSKNIPSELRLKYKLEKKDSGVDGVFILNDGRVAAYQAKFRSNRQKPPYHELAKFWTEAEYTDLHYIIANCYSVTDIAQKKEKHLQILVDEFEKLEKTFFSSMYDLANERPVKDKIYYKPFPFQKLIIKDVVNGLKKYDRGKLIAACGTGKTLTTLWATEELNTDKILFLAPSLALIKQTLEAWADQSKYPFTYLCVCSDPTVSTLVEDEGDISITDFNVPVTTDVAEITQFLSAKVKGKKIIFSTYQSLSVLNNAINSLPEYSFDIIIFDEAHRTAGTKESQLFSLALGNEFIRSKRRLFATATERLIKPWIRKRAEEKNRVIFSMDDISIYGPILHRFNFGQAISEKVISDYKIIVAGIRESELFDWIKQNKDLIKIDKDSKEFYTTAQNLFAQLLLAKATKEFPIRKIISFHSRVAGAKFFTTGFDNALPLDNVLSEINDNINNNNLYIAHINGTMPAGDRKEILDKFKEQEYSVVSNARCLSEGVDVPIIDCVYFVEPKNSLIDIVQACGRALRKPMDGSKGFAFFIIPILIPDDLSSEEILNLETFEMVFNVVQSLRDQDNRLSQWIDQINQNVVKGKYTLSDDQDWDPITINLPTEIDIKDFEEKLYLKIAEVNADPTSKKFEPKKTYGKNERKSDVKRIFKTLGDYSNESYIKNLVEPTLNKFNKIDQEIEISKLRINHNNVSHTHRLGLILKNKKIYSLSPLGKKVYNNELSFVNVFTKQMLRRFEIVKEEEYTRILFPYRACIKILLEAKLINFYEFSFTVYPLFDSSEETINQAIGDIEFIRKNYPRIDLVSESNQKKILHELNKHFYTKFSSTDIWGKQPTTVKNQFMYFRNHLSLFQEFITVDAKSIALKDGTEDIAKKVLSNNEYLESETDVSKLMADYIKPFISFVVFTI